MKDYYIVMIKDPYNECGPYLFAFKRDTDEAHPYPIIKRVKRVIDEVKYAYDDYQWDDLLEGIEGEFGEQFIGEIEHTIAYW